MSSRINKNCLNADLNHPESPQRSGISRAPHADQPKDKMSQSPDHQERDMFSRSSTHEEKLIESNQPESSGNREMLQPPSQMSGHKRAHSPKGNLAAFRAKSGPQPKVIPEQVQKVAADAPEGSVPYNDNRARRQEKEYLRKNPDKKIEQWEHHTLGEIVDIGPCPYTPGRPLVWGNRVKHKKHVGKDIKEIGAKDKDEYHKYMLAVLMYPISKSFPAFFSLEKSSQLNEPDKTNSPPFIRKVYRIDREGSNVIIGDAYGRMITCFHPICKTIDEWFKEKAEKARKSANNPKDTP